MNFAYTLGAVHAFEKLGMYDQVPQVAAPLAAEQFTEFAKNDDTEETLLNPAQVNPSYDKPVHWSGRSSLDSGDAGTRQNEMGVPKFNGI